MSIKIIKEGRKQKEVYETTCEKCDCIFEYNIEDVEKSKNIHGHLMQWIKCPCCGNLLYISPPTFKRYDIVE